MRTCFARAGARHWEGAGGVRNRTRSAALTPETHVVAAASRSSGVAAEKRAEKAVDEASKKADGVTKSAETKARALEKEAEKLSR